MVKAQNYFSKKLCVISTLALVATTAQLATAQCVEDCVAIHTFTGENFGDSFGWVSENAGDIDKDGVNDLIITATGYQSNSGRVYVYSGATGELLFAPITGGASGWTLGFAVDAAGDVDNDGTLDILVGARGVAAGRAFIYSGATGLVIRTVIGENSGDFFGYSVGL